MPAGFSAGGVKRSDVRTLLCQRLKDVRILKRQLFSFEKTIQSQDDSSYLKVCRHMHNCGCACEAWRHTRTPIAGQSIRQVAQRKLTA